MRGAGRSLPARVSGIFQRVMVNGGQRHLASMDEMNLSVYCLWLSLSSEDAVPSSLPPIPPPQSISLEYTRWERKPQLIHDSHLG